MGVLVGRVVFIVLFFGLVLMVQPALAGPVLNVKDYGAVGDGIADDSAAIQRAFDASFASGGATVFFPAGKYFHRKPLLATDTSILGDSRATTELQGASIQLLSVEGSVSKITISNKSDLAFYLNPKPLLQISDSRKDTIQDVAFVGYGRHRDLIALNMLRTTDLQIDGCQFVGTFRQLTCLESENVSIQNCSFSNASLAAITSNNCSNLTVSSNRVSRTANGIVVDRNVGAKVFQNAIEDCSNGIRITLGQNLSVERNTLQRILTSGIVVERCDALIQANDIQLAGQFASVGIEALHGGSSRILSNRLNNCGLGIVVEFVTPGIGIQIVSNTIERVIAGGIRMQTIQTGTNALIDSNLLRDCGLRFFADVISVDKGTLNFAPVITNNSYSGGTNRLRYFIRCAQPSPPAIVTGNTTNTLLPSYIARP